MLLDLTSLPRAVRGVRWDGLALAVDGPDRPPLRWETAEGRRLLLRQGGRTVLLARQRVTHHGVHYARTGRYASPLPPLRAATARARRAAAGDDEDAWAARWAHHFAAALRASPVGPLHEGDWRLSPGMGPRAVDAYWATLARHDPDRGHLTWFGYGDPAEDQRDVLPLRPLAAPDAARVKAYRRQFREGVLPPVLLWAVSGLNAHVVLDGHDRLAAALAEGGRPRILRLGRAPAGGPVPPGGPHLLRAYEERAACLERARTAGDPLAPTRIATAGRRLDAELRALSDGFGLTRGWPLPGGAPAWEASARRHAPGWHPDATR
ncbi:hypothetical protein [Streptomyces sp. NPDC059122]|uniref:hypothetical protein n=1 Tax=Streptomyces sp. NPDC059122 TaxID=3346732 RepID=UPI0036966458